VLILSWWEPTPILPGRRLGPYEILSSIDAGGTGEVYRARDTRVDRIVAIKVLPTHLVDRSELRYRLEREAKTIAIIPSISTLFDLVHENQFSWKSSVKWSAVYCILSEVIFTFSAESRRPRSASPWYESTNRWYYLGANVLALLWFIRVMTFPVSRTW
jgi:serine/threonine protein kinase